MEVISGLPPSASGQGVDACTLSCGYAAPRFGWEVRRPKPGGWVHPLLLRCAVCDHRGGHRTVLGGEVGGHTALVHGPRSSPAPIRSGSHTCGVWQVSVSSRGGVFHRRHCIASLCVGYHPGQPAEGGRHARVQALVAQGGAPYPTPPHFPSAPPLHDTAGSSRCCFAPIPVVATHPIPFRSPPTRCCSRAGLGGTRGGGPSGADERWRRPVDLVLLQYWDHPKV
jgi:hypothetical protein